jgi:DNA replication protein DnaC
MGSSEARNTMGVIIMVVEQTLRLLHKMKLGAIANEYERQLGDTQVKAMSFDDRFGMMVDLDYSRRQNNKLARLIKNAGFPDTNACVEDIIYSPKRELDETLLQRLASCAFIEKKLNIQLLGATGAGKSFIANALGVSACRNGYSVKYINLQDLLTSFMVATDNGTFNQVFSEFKRVKLLIIDDWLMFDVVDDAVASFLYNLIEARKYTGSIIVCSQLDADGWHSRILNKIAADSICDRIVNSSFKIIIKGEMRKELAQRIMSAEA